MKRSNPPGVPPVTGRGGAGRGQGRKAEDGAVGLLTKNVRLDQPTIDTLRSLGSGNLSVGIRLAAKALRERP